MTVEPATVTLRRPGEADAALVRPLVAGTGVFRPDEVDIAVEVFGDAVAQPGVDYLGLGAYDDDTMVGFAVYGPTACTVSTWDLYWIVVDAARHRSGIGRRLLRETERAIAGRGGRLLVVQTSSREDYGPTRRFYEREGYERAARIAGYYAPDDDLIVYTKHLGPPDPEMGHYG